MSKKNPSFRVGLFIGVLAGVLVTGTLAHSGLGKKAWSSFGQWFKAGYVLGYTDAVRLAKQTSMGSYLDKNYVLPKAAPWPKWVEEIDRLYEDPKREKLSVGVLISLAGPVLAEEYGTEPGSDPAEALEKLKAAIAASKAAEAEGDAGAPDAEPKNEEPAED